MKPKVSVIISIYNVEPYLRQCLDSVLGQTHRNLEIILVDDGSPDKCGAICDEYAQLDPRVIVIHKQNEGLSAGWNDGIRMAMGEWITFVDPDDWIDPTFVEDLLHSSDLDKMQVITAASYRIESEKGSKLRTEFPETISAYDGEGKERMMLKTIEAFGSRFAVVWNRLYLRSFLKSTNILFDPNIPAGLSNDAVFNFEVFQIADNVQVVDCIGYHYRLQSSAATLRFRPGRTEKMVYTFERLYGLLADCPLESVKRMLDARVFEDISANLSREFFHPQNTEDYQTVARKIIEMKQIEPYKRVICQERNDFLPWKAMVLKYVLLLPWIWPLKLLYCAKEKIKRFR